MIDRSTEGYVKLLLDIDPEGAVQELESVWAVPVANGYRIDNIPFYARSVASGDVVTAVPDAGGMLRYTGLAESSGHNTIRLWFADEADVQRVRDELRAMGCSSELDLSRLVAVDVPAEVSYTTVRSYLEEHEAAGVFEYEEGCIRHE
jgi:hypothetical protein